MRKTKLILPNRQDPVSYLRSVNDRLETVRRAKVEKYRIYTPNGSEEDWYYSHHPFLTKFKGKYYAFYSSGRRNEDDYGQRVMMGVSEDFAHWELKPLIDSVQHSGYPGEAVLTAAGVYVHDGVMTVLYFGYDFFPELVRRNPDGSPLRPEDKGNRLYSKWTTYSVETTDGEHWSEPRDLDHLFGGNMSPMILDNMERLLWVGHNNVSWTDDLTGRTGWVNSTSKLAPGEPKQRIQCESSHYELPDGTLVLFSRTNGDWSLGCLSFDGGANWTDSYEMGFRDWGAKFSLGKLPDGRIFYLGNNDRGRSQLYLKLSEDGVNFDKWYLLADDFYAAMKKGMYKGGIYGYPTCIIEGDELLAIYSLCKESVEVLRVRLSELN